MKVCVDMFNVLHVAFAVAKTQAFKEKGTFTEEDVGLYYHKVLDSLIGLCKDNGQIIMCNEGRGSLEWRRSIFPEYKANRKKDESYEIFKNHLHDVLDIVSFFPTKIIDVDGAEGDDIMYALATHFADLGEDVKIISGDKDIAQLLNYSDKISVYSPTLKIYREKQDNLILEKAIVGDASDNIPGIPRIGEKTFEKCLADKALWEAKIQPHMDEVKKFIQIVDLSKAPEYIKKEAVIRYDNKDFNEFNPQAIEKFMMDNALMEHLERWQSDKISIDLALAGSQASTKKIELSDDSTIDDLFESMLGNLA